MDLLFKRYASPFLLLDEMICSCRFLNFLYEFMEIHNEEKEEQTLWEFYIHRVFDKPYKTFLEEIEGNREAREKLKNFDSGATVSDSRNMLENFAPVKGGG